MTTKLGVPHVAGGVLLIAVAGLAYLAVKAGGPAKISLPRLTEERQGALQEHVVSRDGLAVEPVFVPHRYPGRVAPWITTVMTHGFAPLWEAPDPQIAGPGEVLPSEVMW